MPRGCRRGPRRSGGRGCPADKATARRSVGEWLTAGGAAYLRINGADTDAFRDDLLLLGLPGAQGVMLAKAEENEPIAVIRRKPRLRCP